MRIRSIKKITGFLILLLLLSTGVGLKAQPVHPYGWPLGSRNQLSIYSPLATAAGETILSQPGPQAAFLNPGLPGLTDDFRLAISGRMIIASTGNPYNYADGWTTYSRKTLNPDFFGLTLKVGSWRIGLGYSLMEEYNRPEILNYYDSRTQDGKLHALQFGISRRVNNHFSLGLSFNYRTGKLRHLDHYDFSSKDVDYQVNLNGFNLQVGLVWEMNKTLTLALVIRPAYRMKVDEKIEERSSETGFVSNSSQFNIYFRFPLALTLSSQIKISENLNLYSDVSYWNWKQFSGGSEFLDGHIYTWPQGHDDIKFSAGLDYAWNLADTKILRLAAGYIHDPYESAYTNINDYLTCGLALDLKKFGLEGSVKLPLAKLRDSFSINSSAFQLGFNFRF